MGFKNEPEISFFIENVVYFIELDGVHCQLLEGQNVINRALVSFDCRYREGRFSDGNRHFGGILSELLSLGFFANYGNPRPILFSDVNITKADLFISAEEVERIKRGEEPWHLPEEEQNSMEKLMRQPRPQRIRSEYLLIAALLADRKTTSAKDLEKAAQSVGAEISD